MPNFQPFIDAFNAFEALLAKAATDANNHDGLVAADTAAQSKIDAAMAAKAATAAAVAADDAAIAGSNANIANGLKAISDAALSLAGELVPAVAPVPPDLGIPPTV